MPAVLTYWQHPDEEEVFLDFLQGTGTVVAFPSHWVATKEELLPHPIGPFIKKTDPPQLRFGLEKQNLRIRIEEQSPTEDGLLFSLPHLEPCLIDYRRGRLFGRKLGQSNISAYWDYPNSDKSSLVEKDQEFLAWAKKVMSWVRKSTPEEIELNGSLYRATKRVKKSFCDGTLGLIL